MLDLILAMMSSATIGLLFKYSEKHGANRYVLTSVNYVAATSFAAILLWLAPFQWPGFAPFTETFSEVAGQFPQAQPHLEASQSLSYAVLLGVPAGLLFFLAALVYQFAVRDAGVSLAGAFSKLGVGVPIVLALVFWREWPSSLQWMGMSLAIAAILIASWPKGRRPAKKHIFLVLLFICMGGAEFSKKLFQKLGSMEHKPLFLMTTFGFALLFSLIPNLAKRRKVARRDVTLGVGVGIANLSASSFLISALGKFPAAVAFPVFSAGSIVAMYIGGQWLFGEQTGIREKWAIALVLPALVLMNL